MSQANSYALSSQVMQILIFPLYGYSSPHSSYFRYESFSFELNIVKNCNSEVISEADMLLNFMVSYVVVKDKL